jgi:hypothetical protein
MIRPFINRAAARAVSLEERVFICVSVSIVIDPYLHNTARAVPVAKTLEEGHLEGNFHQMG